MNNEMSELFLKKRHGAEDGTETGKMEGFSQQEFIFQDEILKAVAATGLRCFRRESKKFFPGCIFISLCKNPHYKPLNYITAQL